MGSSAWWTVFDLVLLVLATLRVTRLVTTDSVGQWWLVIPVSRRANQTKWARYAEGLTCPFCVGFWIGVVAVSLVWLLGGLGDMPVWWRYLAGAFALNYVVGHVSGRLD